MKTIADISHEAIEQMRQECYAKGRADGMEEAAVIVQDAAPTMFEATTSLSASIERPICIRLAAAIRAAAQS